MPHGVVLSQPQFRRTGGSNCQLQAPPIETMSNQMQAQMATPVKLVHAEVLKFIDDPAMFDLEALTCHSCNKSFKTPKAFSNHRDKHQVCCSFTSTISTKYLNLTFLMLG